MSSSFGGFSGDLFNENENEDGLSDDLKTADLGPKSLKLLLYQLRLTCIELKVSLKLQGTNFLLHINQLKKKHDALLNEVASMKKIIDQNILQNTFLEANDDSSANLTNCLHESGKFDCTTSPNAFHQAINIPNGITPLAAPERISTPLNVEEFEQSNTKAEKSESQCTIADMATQIVDCIEETMNSTWKHLPHGQKTNDVLRNHAINALKGIINESYKNNNALNISAIADMIAEPQSMQIDAISNERENVPENVVIPQTFNRLPSVTAKCGLFPQVIVQHGPDAVVVVPRGCEPQVNLESNHDLSVDPHTTVQCDDDSQVTLQHERDPEFALHHCSDSSLHTKRQKKLEKRKERQEKHNRKRCSFVNIRKYITKHLVDTVGEDVTITKFHKIMCYNQDAVLSGNDKENIRIIQICMHANDEASAVTIERSMLPSVFSDDSERYYKVEFENKARNKKASTTNLLGDLSHCSRFRENNEISGNKSPIVRNDHDNDSPLNSFSNDVILHGIENDASPNSMVDIIAEKSPKPQLKRKSNSNSEEFKKNRKSDSLSTSNSSTTSSPLILIEDDSHDFLRKSNQQSNPSTSSAKPVILSNEVIKGDHVKKVFSLIDKEVTSIPTKDNITQTPLAEKTTLQPCRMRKATSFGVSNADAIENVVDLDLPEQVSHYTKTNHSHVNYASNSTNQSFQSLLQKSSIPDPRLQMNATSIYQKMNCTTKKNKDKRNDIYVRTQRKQLSTIPVTIREHLTWDVDDDDEEIIISPGTNTDDDVQIIEIDNTPIELD